MRRLLREDPRGFGSVAPIETLYQGGSKKRPEYMGRVRGPVYLEPQHGYAITADGVLVDETMDANSPVPRVGVTTECRRGRAVADAAETRGRSEAVS